MPAGKREFRTRVVKRDFGPVPFVVAFITLDPVATDMHVIKPVAAIAVCRCVFILLVDMAAVAIQVCMFSRQVKIRIVMIKFLVTPTAFTVTLRTVVTELFFVNIVFFMAINASSRCVAVFFSAGMAGTTVDGGMCPL